MVVQQTERLFERALAHEPGTVKHSLGQAATGQTYYESSVVNTAEAERLKTMAGIMDDVSLLHIAPEAGATIVDLGAGDSTTLGTLITQRGSRYVPVDHRGPAIASHKAAGFNDAREAYLTDTGLVGSVADVVHARLVFGWLSLEQRREALEEMVRVAKEGGKIVIADADWDTLQGPDELESAARLVRDILREAGFDSTYGKNMGEDINSIVSDSLVGSRVSTGLAERISLFQGPIKEAVPILSQTASSLFEHLENIGQTEQLVKLRQKFVELEELAEREPDLPVKLIDLVVREFIVKKPNEEVRSGVDILVAHEPSVVYKEGVDFEKVAQFSDELEDVVLAKSDSLICQIRRAQANSYVREGLIKPDVLIDGMLPENIDPQDQVKRSQYFAAMNPEKTKALGFVRYIKPDSKIGPISLPTISQLGIANSFPDKTIEISAFAKNFNGGTIHDTVRAVIGLSIHAKSHGYKMAIMELYCKHQGMILHIFGDKKLEYIGQNQIVLDGVDGVKLYDVFKADVSPFLEGMYENAIEKMDVAARSGHKEPRLFREITNAIEPHIMAR